MGGGGGDDAGWASTAEAGSGTRCRARTIGEHEMPVVELQTIDLVWVVVCIVAVVRSSVATVIGIDREAVDVQVRVVDRWHRGMPGPTVGVSVDWMGRYACSEGRIHMLGGPMTGLDPRCHQRCGSRRPCVCT